MRFLDMAADLARDEAARLKEQNGPTDSRLIDLRDELAVRQGRLPQEVEDDARRLFSEQRDIARVYNEQFERGKVEGRKALADSLRGELDAFLTQPGLYERFRKDLRLEEVPGAQRGAEILAEHLRAWLEG